MRAGFFQYDVGRVWEENKRKIEQALKEQNLELIVLPELCSCGYLFESKEELISVAERIPQGKTTEDLCRLSREYHCAIVAGLPEWEKGKIYNSAVVVSEGEFIGKYRKIHLSDFEKNFFEKGNQCSVFCVKGVKIGVQICFDLWFPEIAREQIRNGADLFCVPANFGGESSHLITRVRAMENLTPMILCNRVGVEKNTKMDASFLGRSSIIGADGSWLVEGEDNVQRSMGCEISFAEKKNVICSDFLAEMSCHYPDKNKDGQGCI